MPKNVREDEENRDTFPWLHKTVLTAFRRIPALFPTHSCPVPNLFMPRAHSPTGVVSIKSCIRFARILHNIS